MPSFAMMQRVGDRKGRRLWNWVRRTRNSNGGKKTPEAIGASWAQPGPERGSMALPQLRQCLQGSSKEASQMCQSLEVSVAPGRPLPGFDEAPYVAGLVINCGHAVCSCRCKSSRRYFGAYLLMKTRWHFCKHIMVNYN